MWDPFRGSWVSAYFARPHNLPLTNVWIGLPFFNGLSIEILFSVW